MRYFMGTVSTDMEGSGSSFKFSVEDSATDEEVSDKGMQEALKHVSWFLDEVIGEVFYGKRFIG